MAKKIVSCAALLCRGRLGIKNQQNAYIKRRKRIEIFKMGILIFSAILLWACKVTPTSPDLPTPVTYRIKGIVTDSRSQKIIVGAKVDLWFVEVNWSTPNFERSVATAWTDQDGQYSIIYTDERGCTPESRFLKLEAAGYKPYQSSWTMVLCTNLIQTFDIQLDPK